MRFHALTGAGFARRRQAQRAALAAAGLFAVALSLNWPDGRAARAGWGWPNLNPFSAGDAKPRADNPSADQPSALGGLQRGLHGAWTKTTTLLNPWSDDETARPRGTTPARTTKPGGVTRPAGISAPSRVIPRKTPEPQGWRFGSWGRNKEEPKTVNEFLYPGRKRP